MLDVNNVIIPTLYQSYRKDEEFDFDDVDERRKRRRKTKNVDRKRTVERRKLIFKTNVR